MDKYLAINKKAWNNKTSVHLGSDFYNMPDFLKGKSSLNDIELDLLGDVNGDEILHLQCHFGQDTISLQSMGAHVTGVDLSPKSIEEARLLAKKMNASCKFVESDVYTCQEKLNTTFDKVFTSYGTIIWLPDLTKWAKVIYDSLKPGGELVFVDFHPVIWMYDDHLSKITYSYFNRGEIEEIEEGTYADQHANLKDQMITWNHSLSEMIQALIKVGLQIKDFQEYDYAPYPFISNTISVGEKKYMIKDKEGLFPLCYSVVAKK